MPTVWIANEAGHPGYAKARRFGKLTPLTLANQNPLRLDRLRWHIVRALRNFVHPDDYLMISGSPVICAEAHTLWILHFGNCRMLQWNAKSQDYELSTETLGHMNTLLEGEIA